MNTALILIKEPAKISAAFISEATLTWEASKIVELVGCLDVILDWTELYFQEFVLHLIELVCLAADGLNELSAIHSKTLLEQLTLMYEMNLQQTNLKLAMAEYKLGIKNLTITDQSKALNFDKK